ncbi:MAG: Flp pilus assembly protein CpaB [Devosia sp.]
MDRRGVETQRATALFDDEDPAPAADARAQQSKDARERMSFLRSELEREPISKGSPESLAALRAEFRRIHVEGADDTPKRAPTFGTPSFLKPSRLILIAVALVAGGLAAYLATSREAPVAATLEAVTAPPPPVAPMVKVLVATKAIGMGERLSASTIAWQDWPDTALRGEYITDTATPEAITDLAGSMVRFELFPGEPIRADKIVRADQGYLSAVLTPGTRAVSVAVAPEAASGGYIVPNDRVDVVMTRPGAGGQISQTVVHNARVLAIDARLGELGTTGEPKNPADPRTQIFQQAALAVLELDPAQAEVVVNAARSGSLSLVLRPMADAATETTSAQSAANQSIRITSPFWTNGGGAAQ